MRDEPNLKGNCAVYSACELTLHGFWLEGIRHSGVDNLLVNLRKQKAEVQLKLDNRNSNLAAGEERLLNYSNPILKPPDFPPANTTKRSFIFDSIVRSKLG